MLKSLRIDVNEREKAIVYQAEIFVLTFIGVNKNMGIETFLFGKFFVKLFLSKQKGIELSP